MKNNKTLITPTNSTILSTTTLLLTLLLTGCSSNNASHLPSIFELPGAIIGTVFENTRHNAKRRKVEAFVSENYLAIRDDVRKGGGSSLEGVLDATGLKGKQRDAARNLMINDKDHHFRHLDFVVDYLIKNFASLYGVEYVDKKIHRFTFNEAYNLIKKHADNNFEALRIAIEKGDGVVLDQLASQLRINDAAKLTRFKKQAKARYQAIYLEPVIITLMVF